MAHCSFVSELSLFNPAAAVTSCVCVLAAEDMDARDRDRFFWFVRCSCFAAMALIGSEAAALRECWLNIIRAMFCAST